MSEVQAAIEAILYAADEPPTVAQIATALELDAAEVQQAIAALEARYASDEYGVEIRAVAGGYRVATKPQHHEAVRLFLKSLQPPVRLSLAALETLAVIAYRQPVTLPEIREIRGVDAAGVINTLLEKKLVTTAGRKEVVGKPILYRTTREFLIQFGLSGLRDLPTLKEFEEMAQAGLEGMECMEGPQVREETESAPAPSAADPASPPREEPAPSTADPGHSAGASPAASSD